MADAFPISGNIDPKAFPFLLMDLHRHGATGSLRVDGPSYQKALYYRGGRILFGSSNDPRDQLGAILIEDGKISPEQLEDVNAKVGPGNPLAKVLADSGFVSQRELSEAARAKVERILSDIVAYESGSFDFEDGVLPKGAVDLKLSTEKLVFAAVRRIADRGFVLRHLGGLEVVLAQTKEMDAHTAEIEAEAGGLPQQLDGRRTLKEAAALTRLDEFDAAKVACALLFLGMVEEVQAQAAEAGLEATVIVDAPMFVAPQDEQGELDLAGAARMAFEEPPTVAMAPAFETLAPEPEPAAPALSAELEPEPEPTLVMSEAAMPVFAEPEPPAFFPPPEPPPRAAVRDEAGPEIAEDEPAPTLARGGLPLIPPPPKRAPRPEISLPPPPAASRPSREDLAALDSLLNARNVEGPLAHLEKEPKEIEPKFGDPLAGRRGRRERRMNPFLLGAGAFLVLGGIAAGGWYFMHRTPAAAARTTVRPAPTTLAPATTTPATTPTTTAAASATPASPVPVASTPTSPPATPSTPTPAPPTTVAAARPAGGDALAEARSLMQKGHLSEAATAFASHLKTSPGAAFSVQILVACSTDTVQKAVQNVAAPELYILPVNFKGRDCFRLCWGLYDSEGRASSATQSMPDYFRKGGATPKVVATSAILP